MSEGAPRPAMACPTCGEPVEDPAARFCETCGTSLAVLALATAPAGPPAAASEEAVDAALAMASDRGRRHAVNQDSGAVARRPDGAMLLCVADGVSSADNAEGASSDIQEARACVAAAAVAVLDVRRFDDDPDLDPRETTVALAVVRGVAAGIAWVGDSRAYRLDAGRETLLTRDESWA